MRLRVPPIDSQRERPKLSFRVPFAF